MTPATPVAGQPGQPGQPGQAGQPYSAAPFPTQQFPQQPFPGAPGTGQPGTGQPGTGQPTGTYPGAQHVPGQPTSAGQQHGAPQFAGGAFGPAPAPQPRRAGRARLVVAGLLIGAVVGGGAGAGVVALTDGNDSGPLASAAAQSVVIKDPQTATTSTAAAAKAAPSVVTIYVAAGQSSGSGSGIVLSADGYVLTNDHVVTLDSSTATANVQVRTADGKLYDATVVGTDPTTDLAVVKLSDASGLTPATFADSSKVQVGDVAVAIGSPLGLSNTVTDGIISAVDRSVATGSDTDQTVIEALQTDAAINPGNSGGALVDAAGEVIGDNSAIASVATADLPGQQSTQSGNIGVGFAIPSNTAKRISDEIIATGKATHALLGVSTATAADDQNAAVGVGAQVRAVTADSAAAGAGLQAGDVIVSIDGKPVTTSTDLTAAVRSHEPGQEVTLGVQRGGDEISVDVTLGTAAS
jgi:putative serine protease PepD